MSSAYSFLLNMWIMNKITKEELQKRVTSERIIQDEYEQIIATPQL